MWAREHGAARAIPSCWNVPQHHGQPGSLENLLLVPETWQRDTPTSPCHERGTCLAFRLRQKHIKRPPFCKTPKNCQRTPSMIVAITSHFVYQYWSAFWIVSSTSSFKGRITAEVEPPLPLYRALRKRAGCATTKSCRTSWLNWENPQTVRKPLGCASNSSQVWSKCHVYESISSSFHHFSTHTQGKHLQIPVHLWAPQHLTVPKPAPSFSPVSGGKDAPKGVHLKLQKIGSLAHFWCHFLRFCFMRFNPARPVQTTN